MNLNQQQPASQRPTALLESDIAIVEALLSQMLAIARREAEATEKAVAQPH